VVEGLSAAAAIKSNHRFCDSLNTSQNLSRGNALYQNPTRSNKVIPHLIMFGPIAHIICDAIDFENRFRRCAIEVRNIRPNRMLTAKLYI